MPSVLCYLVNAWMSSCRGCAVPSVVVLLPTAVSLMQSDCKVCCGAKSCSSLSSRCPLQGQMHSEHLGLHHWCADVVAK